MRKWLISVAAATAAMAFPAGVSAAPGCTVEKPQVGILYLTTRGPVSAYRRGEYVTLANAAPVCVDDLLTASPASGHIDIFDGHDIPVVARHETFVPGRRHWIIEWLRSVAGRRRAFARPSGAGGPMGDGDAGFALAGVDNGTARIGLNHRNLVIPVNPMPHAFVVELYSPADPKRGDARRMRTARVEPGGRQAVFTSIRPGRGRWSLAIDPGRIVGGFEMVAEPFGPLPPELGALNEREAVLVQACLDPVRNGLEAYLRLLGRGDAAANDIAIVLDWQRPKRRLGCATTPD
ncbi:MAG: hypothetical protein ACXWUZ_11940 [Allosphingosinicella sp.]